MNSKINSLLHGEMENYIFPFFWQHGESEAVLRKYMQRDGRALPSFFDDWEGNSMAEYITHSRAETVALGKRMAAVLQSGALIAFTGGLGAGKTAFTEGLAEGLGCTDSVSSPTLA